MRTIIGGSLAGARKIDGQFVQPAVPKSEHQQIQRERPDKSVRPSNGGRIHFRDLARMAWPQKTEQNIAFVARVDARTARRWLADDNEPPAEVLGIILAEIMKRFHQRE